MRYRVRLRVAVLAFTLAVPPVLFAAGAQAGSSPLAFVPSDIQHDTPVEQQTTWEQYNADGTAGPLMDPSHPPFPLDNNQWVVNPFVDQNCAWDVDDHWEAPFSNRYVDAGTTVTANVCFVAEAKEIYQTSHGVTGWWTNGPRRLSLDLYAPSTSLVVNICYQEQSRCFDIAPTYNKSARQYEYHACIELGYPIVPVADGGVAPYDGSSYGYDPRLAAIPGSGVDVQGVGLLTHVSVAVANPTRSRQKAVSGALDWDPWGVQCAGSGVAPAASDGLFTWAN